MRGSLTALTLSVIAGPPSTASLVPEGEAIDVPAATISSASSERQSLVVRQRLYDTHWRHTMPPQGTHEVLVVGEGQLSRAPSEAPLEDRSGQVLLLRITSKRDSITWYSKVVSGERLSILLVTARPEDRPPFRTGRKVRALKVKLSPLLEQGLVTLAVEPAVHAARLERLLRIHRPKVLHIVCHGFEVVSPSGRSTHVLALEDQQGGTDELSAHELHEIIHRASPETHLVILEACSSTSIAKGLCARDEERVAIGTRKEIQPKAATRFFLSFHEALATGSSIEDAFAQARRDMELFAPSLWAIPILHGREERKKMSLAERPRASSFEIDPDRVDDYVRIAAELEVSSEVYGRDEIFERLDAHWFDEGEQDEALSNVVHLRGDPGRGKTAILARWLALERARGWCGATRVFTWCFDPLARESGTGDVATFFREAFEFFGGVDPYLRAGAGEATQEGEWLQGLRLARIIRHERALLCLDHVPTLPHAERKSYDPHEVFTPGIASLLHEIGRGHAGLCIVTSRLRGELALGTIYDEPVEGIERPAAIELLREHGVVETRATLEGLAAALADEPLMLTLAARALARGALAADQASRLSSDPLTLLGEDPPELVRGLLQALVLRGGALDARELRLVARELLPSASPAAPTAAPRARALRGSWDGFSPEFLSAVRRLQHMGFIEVEPTCSIRIVHAALLHHLPDDEIALGELAQQSRVALQGSPRGTGDVAAFIRTIRTALRSGRAKLAFDVYREDVCRVKKDYYERNFLTRKIGAVADSLRILAEMYEPGPSGEIGMSLRPELLALDDIEHGLLHHQLGLALRHLGYLSDAADRLQAAFEAYEQETIDAGAQLVTEVDQHDKRERLERAAICANDRAEVLAWLGRLDEALESADVAVARAWASCGVDDRDPRMKETAVFVCLGTRGHIHHLRGDLDSARNDFEKARKMVEQSTRGDSAEVSHLFSRPGYYYWIFLLAELRDRREGASTDQQRADKVGALAEQLEYARRWHRNDGTVACVSRALDSVARGQLLLLCHEQGLPCPKSLLGHEPGRVDEKAFAALGAAIHVFRANQHLWMLPEALRARVRAYKALTDSLMESPTDSRGASFDERDAAAFEALMSHGQGVR